ncbi:hypothetical protein QUB63_04995 [Microcoleus sp. ARI1-B5]|uniref:hypothetical protein n=1 Tax=unclassified Microcoleus TaxID=2642155 RepID=UPI002FD33E4F
MSVEDLGLIPRIDRVAGTTFEILGQESYSRCHIYEVHPQAIGCCRDARLGLASSICYVPLSYPKRTELFSELPRQLLYHWRKAMQQ